VDGKDFIKPQSINEGTSYTDQNTFNQALQQMQGQPTQQPVNPYDTQANDLLTQLMNQIKNPQQFDPYSSPQYAAAQQQVQRQSNQGIRAAQESLGASGFGRSTNLTDRAQGIQNNANEYLQTQIIPQLIQQNQAQQQQQFGNLSNILGQVTQQQGLYDNRQQQQLENQLTQEEIAYQKARDLITDEQYKMQFDESVRQFGIQAALEREIQEGRLSIEQAQQALRESQVEYEQQVPPQQDNQQELMSQAISLAQKDPRFKGVPNEYGVVIPPTQQEINQLVQEYVNLLNTNNQQPQNNNAVESFLNYIGNFSNQPTQNTATTANGSETYQEAVSQLSGAENKEQALEYAETINEYLTEEEYSQLVNYINENF